MLSYVHGTGTTPLLGHTIGESLNRAAAQFGDRDALVSCHQDVRYTYDGLLHEVNRAARALLGLGVERGDRVGIWSPNSAEWLITQYAAAKTGAILVNINPAYRLRELEYALKQSGVSVLVASRAFRKTDYVEMLTALDAGAERRRARRSIAAERIPALRHVIYLGAEPTPGGHRLGRLHRAGRRGRCLRALRGPRSDACSSTTPSTSSTRPARRARRKARRSRTTTS